MKKLRFSISALLLLCLPAFASSQGFSISLLAGASRDSRTKTENYWKTGFNAAAHVFVSLPGITVGGRVAYQSWGVDGDGWFTELTRSSSLPYVLNSAEGRQSVIEVVPAVRFALLNPPVGMNIHLQVGAGMFLVSATEVTIVATYDTGTSSGETGWVLTSGSLTGFGPQIALPVRLAGVIEIVPVYSAYNASGEWYNHYSLNAGFSFGL